MKRLNAPKGWSQLLFVAPTEPWAALRAAASAGAAGTTATLIAAGLRGRGGGGFLTGAKWQATAAEPASQYYAVANGYESDPAVFTNRLLMEENPQAIVEGLAIAALTVGAREAFIAVRAEYTEAIKRLEAVIANAEREGILGATLLGTGRELIITVRPLQGSSMIGEETVLMKALAGKRGQPEQTPPYPSEVGYLGKPTAVNNVATLAAVPPVCFHVYPVLGDWLSSTAKVAPRVSLITVPESGRYTLALSVAPLASVTVAAMASVTVVAPAPDASVPDELPHPASAASEMTAAPVSAARRRRMEEVMRQACHPGARHLTQSAHGDSRARHPTR